MEAIAKKCADKNTDVRILDKFPLTNLEDLKKMERKLKKDETFYSKVVILFLLSKSPYMYTPVNSLL